MNTQDRTIRDVMNEVEKLLTCKSCNGAGATLGVNLGVIECNECGGDRHCLYGHEGESLEEILETLLKQPEKQEIEIAEIKKIQWSETEVTDNKWYLMEAVTKLNEVIDSHNSLQKAVNKLMEK